MSKEKHGSSETASITKFNFYGDDLEVVQTPDGEYKVSLARLCESLAIDTNNQRKKLLALPWACTVIITAHDASGRKQELFCIDIRSVAGWLFTVNPGKVRPELREKLVRYQRECAEALADKFLGKRGALPDGALCKEGVKKLSLHYVAKLSAAETRARETNDELEKTRIELRGERHASATRECAHAEERRQWQRNQRGTICTEEYDEINGIISKIAGHWIALGKVGKNGKALTFNGAEKTILHRVVRDSNQKGFRLKRLERARVPGVMRELEILLSDATQEAKDRGVIPTHRRRGRKKDGPGLHQIGLFAPYQKAGNSN